MAHLFTFRTLSVAPLALRIGPMLAQRMGTPALANTLCRQRFVPTGPRLNVFDLDFNLHLRFQDVAQSWVVQKPTADSLVTSLEFFDAQGYNVPLLFGSHHLMIVH